MVQTAINLYSVRDLDAPMRAVVDRVVDAGYDGLQISGGFRDATAEETATMLADRGLGVTPAHVGIERLEDDLDGALADYRDALDCDGAVVPWLDPEHFESEAAVDATAERLASLADTVGEMGWELHYHNHDHEFVDLGDETAFERLLRRTDDVRIELDVGWALVGGVDPAAFVRGYGDRIDLLHMKDMDATERDFREIGEGDVDMAACAEAGRDIGVDWLIYEHDEPADPAASIETGGAFLDGL